MRHRFRSVAVSLALLGAGGAAFAEPVVGPLNDRVHHFDGDEKFVPFFPPAGAFAGGVMNWVYNDANRPAGIAKATAIGQIQASMAKWSAVCRITFNYLGESATGFSSSDGVNVIGWTLTGLTAPTTGDTVVGFNGTNLTDADIRFNAAYSASYNPSLDVTAVHEVGHALGLNHSDVAGQVMSGPPLTSYNGATTLGADDIAGCVRLYGSAGGAGPDAQAPSVPANVAATPVSASAINLTWAASTDNVAVTNYKVFQGGTLLGSVNGTGASITGLAPGTLYSFTVSACDAAANCSAQSAMASATTLGGDAQPPTVPANLTAMPSGTSAINLAWSASTDNVGVANYRVFQGGTLLGTVIPANAWVTGLAPATLYTFTVAACDAAANCSAQSAPASATTPAVAPPVTCAGPQPPDDRQTLACPGGQQGSIVQSRSYTCVGSTWTAGMYQTISNTCPAVASTNYQDLWWTNENGWGLSITQHRDVLFLTWYIYDATGKPVWVVMSSGQWDAARVTYSGDVFIPNGTWFGNYDGSRFIAGAPVGTASVRFANASSASLTYSINGLTGAKAITRQPFGPVNTAPIASYGDMWWGGTSQNGWGLAISQQYHNLFATWFTYDPSGQVTWFVMSGGSWTTPTTYSGELYRTRGAQVLGVPYNPAALTVTQVGTLTLTFSDTEHATMAYTVDGLSQSKPITRLPF